MQIKNRFLLIFFIFLSFDPNIFAGGGELWIYNNSANDVWVHVYPVSMVFNNDTYGTNGRNYSLLGGSKVREGTGNIEKYFMNGTSVNDWYTKITPNQSPTAEWGFDGVGGTDQITKGTIGFGRWRVDFYESENINGNPVDYCILDFDYGYTIRNQIYQNCGSQSADVYLKYIKINNQPKIQFLWQTCICMNGPSFPYQDVPVSKYVLERDRGCPDQSWPPDKGNFRYNSGSPWVYTQIQRAPNNYEIIPQDPRRDCVTDIYPDPPFINIGIKSHNQFFRYAYTINYLDYYYPSDIGRLTLNLTIEKNVSTPDYLTWYLGDNDFPIVYPSPIIVTDGASLILEKGSPERHMIFKQCRDPFTNNLTNLNTPLEVYPNGTLELKGNSTEKSHIYFESYSYSIIWQNANLIMGQNSAIDLQGNSFMKFKGNSKIYQYTGSRIDIRNTSTLLNCGAQFPVSNGCVYALYNSGRYLISNRCPEDYIDNNEFFVENGTSFELYDSSRIEIEANNKMIFSGENTYLKAAPGTSIILGEGASIEFRNGAYLDADGCTFTSVNSGEIWEGILLDGAGSVTNIRNCTFNDAATSITVTNTICNIANNTFNISNNSSCIYGINAVNETNITIAGNTFNAGSNSVAECIRFFNYETDGLPGGGGSSAYTLNIYNNTFNGSVNAIDIQCLTASQLPFYIANNSFYPAGSITSNGIYAYNITGNIKNNYFYNANSNKSVTLQFSTVNLFNNTLYSVNQNIWSSNSTLMQMAPLMNAFGQWVWYGGYNTLNSGSLQNIEFRSYSNPTISPNGLNCFTVTTQPNFLGELCLGTKPYKAYDNFWSPSVSGSSFNITCNSNPVNVTYTPNLSTCPVFDPDGSTGTNVTDLTNGIYDTVYITSGGEGGSYPGSIKKTLNNADILYFEALQKRKQRDYAGAINKCKELINEHDTSSYFNSAMSELYLNYLESDTSGNQTITNGLFNNLKTYIEQKMQQYPNNTQFVERAYKYHLMCLVKTKSYTEAIAGYENIMNNHPDPIVRLNASWDRSAVVFMMGQGGSENDNSVKSSKSRNTKLLDKNPAHRIAKDIFREQKVQSEQIEKNITDEQLNNEDISTVVYTKEEKQMLERRIENYNPTDKKDFMEKLSKDIKLIEQINTAKNTKKTNSNVPRSFKLHQNYPNPFNPTTTIKYEIPKDAEITIKVYDLLGREVFSINEYKKAGSYEVKFDGANLASGMYLYSLEVSDPSTGSGRGYMDTKKMVLLK